MQYSFTDTRKDLLKPLDKYYKEFAKEYLKVTSKFFRELGIDELTIDDCKLKVHAVRPEIKELYYKDTHIATITITFDKNKYNIECKGKKL